MATALQLANRALLVLGEPRLTNFAQAGSTAALVNELFPITFRKLLKEDDWWWARKRAWLVEDTTLTHLSQFEYAYDLPTDMLHPLSVYGEDGLEIVYELDGSHLFSNSAPDDVEEYPRMLYTADCLTTDTAGFPELVSGYADIIPQEWVEMFAYNLAADLAWPVTRDDKITQRIRGEQLYLHQVRAKQLNAAASPGYGPPDEDWGGVIYDSVRRQPRRV